MNIINKPSNRDDYKMNLHNTKKSYACKNLTCTEVRMSEMWDIQIRILKFGHGKYEINDRERN